MGRLEARTRTRRPAPVSSGPLGRHQIIEQNVQQARTLTKEPLHRLRLSVAWLGNAFPLPKLSV